MDYLSDLLTWRFSLGFFVGIVVGIGLMFRLTNEAAAEAKERLSRSGQARRAVEIIHRITAKEMSGPGVKDASARLAAKVFIAGIEADAGIQSRPRG